MRPAFRRGWEGEGKPKSMPWRGPAGAQRPPHGGVYFGFGNERAKPLAFPHNHENGGVSLPQPHRGSRMAPSQRRDADDRRGGEPSARQGCCANRSAASRSERAPAARSARREARAPAGQHENAAPLGARSAGESASLRPPAHFTAALPFPLPIVTRMGRDYRPGSRQRIERVARRAASQIAIKLSEAQGSAFQAVWCRRRAQTIGFPVPRQEEAIVARYGLAKAHPSIDR